MAKHDDERKKTEAVGGRGKQRTAAPVQQQAAVPVK